jgi:hypothetical protein
MTNVISLFLVKNDNIHSQLFNHFDRVEYNSRMVIYVGVKRLAKALESMNI